MPRITSNLNMSIINATDTATVFKIEDNILENAKKNVILSNCTRNWIVEQ